MYELYANGRAAGVSVDTMRASYVAASGGLLDEGRWVHVAGVFRYNDAIAFYMDGAFQGQTALADSGTLYSGLPVQVGASAKGAFFVGEIDDVRIFHRALPACAVAYLARF